MKIRKMVAGITTIKVPARRLNKKLAREGVMIYQFYNSGRRHKLYSTVCPVHCKAGLVDWADEFSRSIPIARNVAEPISDLSDG